MQVQLSPDRSRRAARAVVALVILAFISSVGRAEAQPTLAVTPLDLPPNTPATITVTGTPGHAWAVGGSLHSSGYRFNGVDLALGTDPIILGSGILDASGTVTFVVAPPRDGLNTLYFLQAMTAPTMSFADPQVSDSVTVRPAGTFTNTPEFPQGLSAGGGRITDLGAPSLPTDAANKAYVDEAIDGATGGEPTGTAGGDLSGTYPNPTISPAAGSNIVDAINASAAVVADGNLPAGLARLGGNNTFSGSTTFNGDTTLAGTNTFTGANLFNSAPVFAAGLSAGNARIQNLGAPVNAGDAATKAYVDSLSGGGADVLRAGQLTSVSTAQPILRLTQTGAGPLMRLRTNSSTVPGTTSLNMDMFFVNADGAWVSGGEIGEGIIPETGAGTRTMWYPYKVAFRTGGVSGTQWDDAHIGFYSFAGGNDVIAEAFATFAYGDRVTVSGINGVGFGSVSTVSGTAGFSSGANNTAGGFASATLGFNNIAAADGSVAIGYRVASCSRHSVVLGHRASSATGATDAEPCAGTAHSGAFVFGDQSTTDHFTAAADNEFAVRAAGGFRFRTHAAATTGCDLPPNSGVFSCSSDRNLKSDIALLDGETILRKVAALPVTSWRFLDEAPGIRHVGPMAQDFYAAFGLGDSDRMIGYTDINGINMRAIQALESRTHDLQQATDRIRTLEERLTRLEAQLEALAKARQ